MITKNELLILGLDREIDVIITEPYINGVYNILKELGIEYPNFYTWYHDKIVPGLLIGDRKIIISLVKNIIAGVAILKCDKNEKKICTLRVHPFFRSKGIGTCLMGKSLEILGTPRPLITVSGTRVIQFIGLFRKYGFKLTQVCKNYYTNGRFEYIFNGSLYLPPVRIDQEKIQNINILDNFNRIITPQSSYHFVSPFK